jgi:hypothetical protein
VGLYRVNVTLSLNIAGFGNRVREEMHEMILDNPDVASISKWLSEHYKVNVLDVTVIQFTLLP